MGDVDLLMIEAQNTVLGFALQRPGGTLLQQRTARAGVGIKVGGVASILASGNDLGLLSARTLHGLWRAVVVAGEHEIGHAQSVIGGLTATNRRLVLLDAVRVERLVGLRSVVAAVGMGFVHVGALDQIGHRLVEHCRVIGVIRLGLHLDHQLHVVIRVAGFGDVRHVALVAFAAFLAVGSFGVVGRLQAVGAQFRARFQPNLGRFLDEVLAVDTQQHRIGRRIAISFRQLVHQPTHEIANFPEMRRSRSRLDVICVLSRCPARIGLEIRLIAGLIRLTQHPPHPLQHLHQQLQAAHLADVAAYQRAIHSQLVRFQRQCGDLLVGHLLEGLLQQILARLAHVLRQPPPKVVHRPDVQIALGEIAVAERVAHLHVVAELLLQLRVAPAEPGLEHFQAHQHIHRRVRARERIAVENGEDVLVDATEKLGVEGSGPRGF